MNHAIIVGAIIAVIGDLIVTVYSTKAARRASEQSGSALAMATANQDLLHQVKDNGDDIRAVLDRNHDVLVAVHGFEEYQHARNHDLMNAVVVVSGKLDQLLVQQSRRDDRMIELLERIADK